MRVGAVIVAAGQGRRMGKGMDKLFLKLDGIPLLARGLIRFQRCPEINEIVLVVNPALQVRFEREVIERYRLSKVTKLVAGGERRQDSVYRGLSAFTPPPDLVLIHDGDRPFVSIGLIRAVLKKSKRGGAIAAVRATDTIKIADKAMRIVSTLDRSEVWLAQTPQGFPFRTILAAHKRAREEGWEATDDAALVERNGGKVAIVEGSSDNIKITTLGDYELARSIHSRLKTAG